MLGSESTTFTLENMGRYLCNTLQEAFDGAAQGEAGARRDFDVIIIGGGTFGSVMAEALFQRDRTHSRRILVLEQARSCWPSTPRTRLSRDVLPTSADRG